MDKYHLFQDIGSGHMSQIFKGREKRTVEFVAIKRIDKSRMSAIVHEVQTMHRLRSPHCLRFYDWYETRNNLWLILEYCAGGDLLSLIRQDGAMPESAVKVFGVDIMAGLQYLHSEGLIFSDLKPSNILLDEYGVLKLADFSLARPIPETRSDVLPIDVGLRDSMAVEVGQSPLPGPSEGGGSPRRRGTPHYMAPELFLADGVHAFASDLWSLGIVLFELRTATVPFKQERLKELMSDIFRADPFEAIAQEEHPHGPLGEDLRDLIAWLMDKDSAQRPQWREVLDHPATA